jgi:hypothetical protein
MRNYLILRKTKVKIAAGLATLVGLGVILPSQFASAENKKLHPCLVSAIHQGEQITGARIMWSWSSKGAPKVIAVLRRQFDIPEGQFCEAVREPNDAQFILCAEKETPAELTDKLLLRFGGQQTIGIVNRNCGTSSGLASE